MEISQALSVLLFPDEVTWCLAIHIIFDFLEISLTGDCRNAHKMLHSSHQRVDLSPFPGIQLSLGVTVTSRICRQGSVRALTPALQNFAASPTALSGTPWPPREGTLSRIPSDPPWCTRQQPASPHKCMNTLDQASHLPSSCLQRHKESQQRPAALDHMRKTTQPVSKTELRKGCFKKKLFICLAASGLSCSTRALQSWCTHGLSCPEACGILVPWRGIKPGSPA